MKTKDTGPCRCIGDLSSSDATRTQPALALASIEATHPLNPSDTDGHRRAIP